jgi:hypothetical protein
MTRERWMALFFATGSACFLFGPLKFYADWVGDTADAVTFFVGSILFTAGGTLQSLLAYPSRHGSTAGRAGWRAAIVQSAGTLFFNVTTFMALDTAITNSKYDRLVWRPDAFGSIAFLVSGFIAYRASVRRGWLPAPGAAGWWEPGLNLLGCIFFGISAVAGYVRPATDTLLSEGLANWNTTLGAACFLVCAVPTLVTGRTLKSPRFRRLAALERGLVEDVERVEAELAAGES